MLFSVSCFLPNGEDWSLKFVDDCIDGLSRVVCAIRDQNASVDFPLDLAKSAAHRRAKVSELAFGLNLCHLLLTDSGGKRIDSKKMNVELPHQLVDYQCSIERQVEGLEACHFDFCGV